jgi:hypothetical protein
MPIGWWSAGAFIIIRLTYLGFVNIGRLMFRREGSREFLNLPFVKADLKVQSG